VIPEAQQGDTGVADLFSIDRFDVIHVTAIERSAGIRIVTDARQWSHALEFTPRRVADFADGPLLVDVRLDVESGRIEVGALSTTGTTFLSASTVEHGAHAVALQVPALSRCQSLVVRNAGAGEATVRILSISTQRTPAVADGPDLSAPYGSSTRGFWDKNIFADIRRLAGADARTVVHVGAHHGEEAALFLRMFSAARVHCYEPSPATAATLRQALSGEPRAEVHQIALADRAGLTPFHINARPETNSLFPLLAAEAPESAAVVTVQSSTLDQQFDALHFSQIDVLCLDTQGAELLIMRGGSRALRQQQVRVLMTELIFVPLYDGQGSYFDVLHFLGHAGYRLYDLYNFRYDDSGKLLWGDALFLPDSSVSNRSDSV
jgi:FkbM family methyltransferase